MMHIEAINFDRQSARTQIDKLPDTCPYCHHGIEPRVLGQGLVVQDENPFSIPSLQLPLLCTKRQCQRMFTAYYQHMHGEEFYLSGTSRGILQTSTFSEEITKISPGFVTIYNQAHIAEQEGLDQICGVGYGKALEFLVKDYLIHRNPDQKEVIRGKLLGKTIVDHITHEQIKDVAERAAWLRNDETHYVRKFTDKELKHLKELIDLTRLWIEMEIKTEQVKLDMPKQ